MQKVFAISEERTMDWPIVTSEVFTPEGCGSKKQQHPTGMHCGVLIHKLGDRKKKEQQHACMVGSRSDNACVCFFPLLRKKNTHIPPLKRRTASGE